MAKTTEPAEGGETPEDSKAAGGSAPAGELSEGQLDAVSGGFRDIAVTWAWNEQGRPAYQPAPAPDNAQIYED